MKVIVPCDARRYRGGNVGFEAEGMRMSDEPEESQWPVLITLGAVVVAVYVPFIWVFFDNFPASEGNRIGLFVLMPSSLFTMLTFNVTGSPVCQLLGPLVTLYTVAGLAYAGRRGGGTRIVIVVSTFVGSVFLSVLTLIVLHVRI